MGKFLNSNLITVLLISLALAAPAEVFSQQFRGVRIIAPSFEPRNRPAEDDIVRAFGQVSLNVAKGVHVTLGNRSTGRITVTGWDRDVISARAVSERGQEAMIIDHTSAPLDFFNVSGDVDAVAANSSGRFERELTRHGRYHLRSMSGRVEMIVPAGSTGFSATLSSYRGRVESDFPLKSQITDARKDNAREGEPEAGWRLTGQFGSPERKFGLIRLKVWYV